MYDAGCAEPPGWPTGRASVVGPPPSLGLPWYLLAQSFPAFAPLFCYVLRALRPAALPLALYRPRRPELALAAQALADCMLAAHATPATVAAWVAVLMLTLPAHLRTWPARACLLLGLPSALLLQAAASQLWLVRSSGNANFLFGANLLWGGLVLATLHSMLRTPAGAGQQVGSDGLTNEYSLVKM